MKRKKEMKPIENHKTAAWADVEDISKITKINQPNQMQVQNAKEYVDENQK